MPYLVIIAQLLAVISITIKSYSNISFSINIWLLTYHSFTIIPPYCPALKTSKELSHFKFKIYVAMWPLVMYSNYYKIVSTVTLLGSWTRLISGIFLHKS